MHPFYSYSNPSLRFFVLLPLKPSNLVHPSLNLASMAPKSKRGEESSSRKRDEEPVCDSTPPPQTRERSRKSAKEWWSTLFVSRDAYLRFKEDISMRSIVSSKIVPIKFLENNFPSFIEKFRAIGWEFLMSHDDPVYPELVREFYANFVPSKPQEMAHSMVRGKMICLDADTLNAFMQCGRYNVTSLSDTIWPTHAEWFNPHEALKLVTGNPNMRAMANLKSKDLTVEFRVLHHMITYNISPRNGGRDYVTHEDIFAMYCVWHGYGIDLPSIIVRDMEDNLRRKNGCLPFARLLTCLFTYHHVSFASNTGEFPTPDDEYSESTLKRMRFVQDKRSFMWFRQGQRVPVDKAEEAIKEEEEEEEEMGDQGEDVGVHGVSGPHDDYYRQCLERMDARITTLEDNYARDSRMINTRLTDMENGLNKILKLFKLDD